MRMDAYESGPAAAGWRLLLLGALLSMAAGCGIFPEGTFGAKYPNNPISVVIDGPTETGVRKMAQFSAAKSNSVLGGALTVTWTLVSQPMGSTATLNSLTGVVTTMFVDKGGYYAVEASVADANGNINARTIILNALGTGGNHPPVAILTITESKITQPAAPAGGTAPPPAPSLFILDASKSYDIDGNQMDFQWAISGNFSGNLPTESNYNSSILYVTAFNGMVNLKVFDGVDFDEIALPLAPTAAAGGAATTARME
ncbi:MAG: hypothetical protein OEV92_00890 [Nitrospinota bacterium]|nr:hypothetical protein [Nitrospinota bacterium]